MPADWVYSMYVEGCKYVSLALLLLAAMHCIVMSFAVCIAESVAVGPQGQLVMLDRYSTP